MKFFEVDDEELENLESFEEEEEEEIEDEDTEIADLDGISEPEKEDEDDPADVYGIEDKPLAPEDFSEFSTVDDEGNEECVYQESSIYADDEDDF